MTDDSFLWYNVGQWDQYGLAVPNFGNDPNTQNSTIRNLVETFGRNLQAVMWHKDARLSTPPTINTLTRIHKLCVRVRDILASRAVPAGQPAMESAHAIPAPEMFRVYPTPYFLVRNSWMKEWCGLALIALTEAAQHQENASPLEISIDFAKLFGQYTQRIYQRMAVELIKVPLVEAQADNFTLTDAQLAAYNPSAWFTSTEMIDTVPDLINWPTEDDLKPLTDGIPYGVLPKLGRYPMNPSNLSSMTSSATSSAAASSWPGSTGA